MENAIETDEIETEENEETPVPQAKSRDTFELDGVGEFRAKKGTALHELAGAATYWQKQCKTAEARFDKQLQRIAADRWRDGLITGVVTTLVAVAIGISISLLT